MRKLLLLLVFTGLGCVADAVSTSEGSSSGVTARQYFEDNVYPLLARKCGACHMGSAIAVAFVANDRTTAYDTILKAGVAGDFSINAPLVGLVRPAHRFDYQPAELDTILEWLRLEREPN